MSILQAILLGGVAKVYAAEGVFRAFSSMWRRCLVLFSKHTSAPPVQGRAMG